MLADMTQNKSDCEVELAPPDLFTGLYAVGRGDPQIEDGCGGTPLNREGQLKNTGYRVCQFFSDGACAVRTLHYLHLPSILKGVH
jgi:hypothetical protein